MSSYSIGRRVLRKAAAPATAVALALGLSAALATPATASGSYTGKPFVYGDSLLTSDWDDEGIVDVRTHRTSDVTCLWQTILYADGYLPASAVDGIFDDQTRVATVNWQRIRGVNPDGSVDRATFARAGQRISDNGSADGYRNGRYQGTDHSFLVRRPTEGGNWMFLPPGRGFIAAAYNWRTC